MNVVFLKIEGTTETFWNEVAGVHTASLSDSSAREARPIFLSSNVIADDLPELLFELASTFFLGQFRLQAIDPSSLGREFWFCRPL